MLLLATCCALEEGNLLFVRVDLDLKFDFDMVRILCGMILVFEIPSSMDIMRRHCLYL